MTTRFKARVCVQFPAEIATSNPAWDRDVFVCECCVLSGISVCDELITRLEEFQRMSAVVVCNLETSRLRRAWSALSRSATLKEIIIYKYCKT